MHIDDVELVKKTLAGNRGAFDCLVKQYTPLVFSRAHRFFRDRQTVEDVSQEVFLRAYRSLHTYGQTSPFASWLTTIAVRQCYRRLKKEKSRPEKLLSDFSEQEQAVLETICVQPGRSGPPGPEAGALARDLAEKVLEGLNPREKMVLILTEVEGLSVQEVSKMMGLSPVYVKVSGYRARKKAGRVLREISKKGAEA